MATFWGVDLAARKVAVARLPLPEAGVLYVDGGEVKPHDHEKRLLRICHLAGSVECALRGAGPEDVLAIEDPSASRQSHAYNVGEVFSPVLRVIASRLPGRWFFVHPQHLHMFATGDNQAPKSSMGRCAYKHWGFEPARKGPASEDEVDAFCLAQMARCVLEPEDFTAYQRGVLAKCWVDSSKKRGPKNLQFVLRPGRLAEAEGTVAPRVAKRGRRKPAADAQLAL